MGEQIQERMIKSSRLLRKDLERGGVDSPRRQKKARSPCLSIFASFSNCPDISLAIFIDSGEAAKGLPRRAYHLNITGVI